jgi:hypothetical protein
MEPKVFKARAWLLLAGALSLCVLACAQDSTPSPVQTMPPKRIPPVAPVVTLESAQPTGEPAMTASMPRIVRRAVVVDAARRFQVAEDAVVLASAEQVTWNDGSLGCPQPGQSYTQGLVPGYRVTAVTATGRMLYHADTRGNVVTCGVGVQLPKDADVNSQSADVESRTQLPVKEQPDR